MLSGILVNSVRGANIVNIKSINMSEGLKTIEKPKARLKTPISYYGGKQSMLKHILPIIPEHTIYVEPFFGGGAVF